MALKKDKAQTEFIKDNEDALKTKCYYLIK